MNRYRPEPTEPRRWSNTSIFPGAGHALDKRLPPDHLPEKLICDFFTPDVLYRQIIFCQNMPLSPGPLSSSGSGFIFVKTRYYQDPLSWTDFHWVSGTLDHRLIFGDHLLAAIRSYQYFPQRMLGHDIINNQCRPSSYRALLKVLGVDDAFVQAVEVPPPAPHIFRHFF